MDKYQGQQNDYILLSLVRTRAVGHIRDVRRLVVAMSRSRLGLYIFGRQSLFANCYELQPTLTHLLKRPTVPALHPREHVQVLLINSSLSASTSIRCNPRHHVLVWVMDPLFRILSWCEIPACHQVLGPRFVATSH